MFSTLRDWSAAWLAPSTPWGGGWRPGVTTSPDDLASSGNSCSDSDQSVKDDDAPPRKTRKRETKPRQARFGYTTDATGEGGGGAAAFRFVLFFVQHPSTITPPPSCLPASLAPPTQAIVDGGYNAWDVLICPMKRASDDDSALWSKRLESVRKDTEVRGSRCFIY